jgi:predicted transcriptional regulator
MNKSLPVGVRLRPELDDRVATIAALLDRPKSWVIEQAVKDFVAVHEWQLTAIDQGIRAADAGQVAGHDAVASWVQSWGDPDELPMPKCG